MNNRVAAILIFIVSLLYLKNLLKSNMYSFFSHLLYCIILGLKNVSIASPMGNIAVHQCPYWQGGNVQHSYVMQNLSACDDVDNNMKVWQTLDQKIVGTSHLYNSQLPMPPPQLHWIDHQQCLIVWQRQKGSRSNRIMIAGRLYNMDSKHLGTIMKIASVFSAVPLNITLDTSKDWLEVKWGPATNASKQLAISNSPGYKRNLLGATPPTNSSFNLTDLGLTLVPNQVVFLNTTAVISVKIGTSYEINLQQMLTHGGNNLTGDWWNYNSSNYSLIMAPTSLSHLGVYTFLVKAENDTQGNITHVFQVSVQELPNNSNEPDFAKEFTENCFVSLALGMTMGFSVLSTMWIYYVCCAIPKKIYYEREYKKYLKSKLVINTNYDE